MKLIVRLLLNLFTALLATWVISKFGASIEQMVALAFLMPIVASMGGNAAMQTLAVTIRALATKELSSGNFGKIATKEFIIGILNIGTENNKGLEFLQEGSELIASSFLKDYFV